MSREVSLMPHICLHCITDPQSLFFLFSFDICIFICQIWGPDAPHAGDDGIIVATGRRVCHSALLAVFFLGVVSASPEAKAWRVGQQGHCTASQASLLMHGEYFDEVLAVQHKTRMRNVWSRAAGCSRRLFAGLVAFPFHWSLNKVTTD